MASQSLQIQKIKELPLLPVSRRNYDIGVLEVIMVQARLMKAAKKVCQPPQESPATAVALAPL